MASLQKGFGEYYFSQLELVEADLNDETSLLSACAGATYIVHTASPPIHFQGDCVGPAVRGMTAVMKACTQHQSVKRCVVTSSVAAILCTAKEDKPVPPDAFNETHWSNPDRPEGLINYERSKTLAEKTA
jgi:nucleoside-diphosphate-sugar epimerase